MKILEAYKEFSVNYLQARAYSPVTISGYWWIVKSFVEAVGNIDTSHIEMEHVSAWIGYMQSKGNTKMTVSGNMGRFRVFIEYLNLQGHCYLSKELIRPPRKPKTIPKYSTQDEIELMVRHAASIRDKAIISLLFSTGIRNSELRNLLVSDYEFDRITIREGKNSKGRVALISQRAKTYLDLYLEGRTDDLPYLFRSNLNNKIANSSLRSILATASQKAGVKHTSPHTIRHGFATHLLNNQANIRVVQEAMGHEDIRTTQHYTHVTLQDYETVHKRIFDKH
jgi:site-specific recombinase XerD